MDGTGVLPVQPYRPNRIVRLRCAALFMFGRTVAGQILTGWEAGRHGIPEDIIAQTDHATLSISFHCRSFECIGNNQSVQQEMHSKSAKCKNIHYYYPIIILEPLH